MYRDIDGFPENLTYENIYSVLLENIPYYLNEGAYRDAVNQDPDNVLKFDTKRARDLLIHHLGIEDTDFTRKYEKTYILQLVHGALLTLNESECIDFAKNKGKDRNKIQDSDWWFTTANQIVFQDVEDILKDNGEYKPVPIKYTGHPLYISNNGRFNPDLFYTQLLLIWGEDPLSKTHLIQNNFSLFHIHLTYCYIVFH